MMWRGCGGGAELQVIATLLHEISATRLFCDFAKFYLLNHFNFTFFIKTQLTFHWNRHLTSP